VRQFIIGAIVCSVALTVLGTVNAEKLTTVGVVDIEKIVRTFSSDLKATRNYEQARQTMQDDLNAQVSAITKLKDQKLSATTKNDKTEVLRLDQEITQKTSYLNEYRRVKSQQLEEMKKSIGRNDDLMQQIDSTIEYIAISEGYTVVLNVDTENTVYWHSTEVDITQKVIDRLRQQTR